LPGASEQQIEELTNVSSDQSLILLKQMTENGAISPGFYSAWVNDRQISLRDGTMVNGALLFIGALLSVVFIMGTVIIMYYKQISEGFEDQERFGIMKKVGMTSKEIQATVNSQMMTVFLAPAVLAGIHLIFATPALWTFLRYTQVSNTGFLIAVTGGIFAIYVLSYIVIYRLTANAYAKIINV
ncbi:MAG: hypothetical protein HUJ54_14420, partial [Erysipelotrichaceae bacterium]|nr:hypothetical protein [Erysipelotrichaceae bacterium]